MRVRWALAALLLASCGPAATHVTTHKAPDESGAKAVRRLQGAATPIVRPYRDAPESATTSTTLPPPVTTTTEAPTTTTTEPARPPATAASRGAVTGQRVESTAYCLTGNMANGRPTHVGAVAANSWPLGTVLDVSDSPTGPGRFTVEDRIGSGSQLDFALPSDCAAAREWGRRVVTVEVVP